MESTNCPEIKKTHMARVVVYPEIFEKTRPEPSGIPNGIPGIVFFFEFSKTIIS